MVSGHSLPLMQSYLLNHREWQFLVLWNLGLSLKNMYFATDSNLQPNCTWIKHRDGCRPSAQQCFGNDASLKPIPCVLANRERPEKCQLANDIFALWADHYVFRSFQRVLLMPSDICNRFLKAARCAHRDIKIEKLLEHSFPQNSQTIFLSYNLGLISKKNINKISHSFLWFVLWLFNS